MNHFLKITITDTSDQSQEVVFWSSAKSGARYSMHGLDLEFGYSATKGELDIEEMYWDYSDRLTHFATITVLAPGVGVFKDKAGDMYGVAWELVSADDYAGWAGSQTKELQDRLVALSKLDHASPEFLAESRKIAEFIRELSI